jgi:hypothetical protein
MAKSRRPNSILFSSAVLSGQPCQQPSASLSRLRSLLTEGCHGRKYPDHSNVIFSQPRSALFCFQSFNCCYPAIALVNIRTTQTLSPGRLHGLPGLLLGIHAGLTQSWVFTGSRSAYPLEMSHSILWPFARLSGMIGGAVNGTSFWRSCNPGQVAR